MWHASVGELFKYACFDCMSYNVPHSFVFVIPSGKEIIKMNTLFKSTPWYEKLIVTTNIPLKKWKLSDTSSFLFYGRVNLTISVNLERKKNEIKRVHNQISPVF